jgi:OCT family organic cation transporter-like MFS transporter 4/5
VLIGSLISPLYADNKGRRGTTIIGWIVTILGILTCVAAPNITVASVGLFFVGVGAASASNIGLIYMVEVFESNLRQKSMAAISVCSTIGGMAATLFYYLFKDWWKTTVYSLLLPAVAALILMLIFLQESPMFLLRQGATHAQHVMNKIARLNTGRSDLITLEDIKNVMDNEQVEEYNQTITPLDLFRFPSLRIITICGSIISIATYMMYFGPILIVGQIGFDIYTTNVVLNSSDLLVYYPLFLIIDKIRRKKTAIILMSVAAAVAGVLVFVVVPSDCNGSCSQIVVQLVLVFVFRFCISMLYAIIMIYAN